MMVKTIQLIAGLILLIALEILRVYFIMPFPGSQRSESVDLAYFLHNNIFYFRFIGLLIILFPAIHFLWFGNKRAKWLTALALLVYALIFYLFNYRFLADKMFYQPKHKIFAERSINKVADNDLVVGVDINGESKAYPIEVIGYHHQVRDTIGNVPVMITYCTVCRTGRVYSPVIDGKPEVFRLVGMDHFNAMFEDASTRSWWRQVNGEAIAGPMKGKTLREIPSEQMSLRAWLEDHPDSKILQPDSTFKEKYEGLAKFDEGTIEGGLEKRDSLSWKEKSWIVGVQLGMQSRAYDWNDLIAMRVINDTLNGTPLLIAVENDSITFHVWNRGSNTFGINNKSNFLEDEQTNSHWHWNGKCAEGPLKDSQLEKVQAYQEFWHSWKTFRPNTSRYEVKK